jgi:hypothetical protein
VYFYVVKYANLKYNNSENKFYKKNYDSEYALSLDPNKKFKTLNKKSKKKDINSLSFNIIE